MTKNLILGFLDLPDELWSYTLTLKDVRDTDAMMRRLAILRKVEPRVLIVMAEWNRLRPHLLAKNTHTITLHTFVKLMVAGNPDVIETLTYYKDVLHSFNGAPAITVSLATDPNVIFEQWWFLFGVNHRRDKPAFISYHENGEVNEKMWADLGLPRDGLYRITYNKAGCVMKEEYRYKGERHGIDKPAIIKYYPDRTVLSKMWYHTGDKHRLGKPAEIRYHKNGALSMEMWYYKNKLHRLNGPAILRYNEDGETIESALYFHNGKVCGYL